MNITELRRANLRQWIDERCGGRQALFAQTAAVNPRRTFRPVEKQIFRRKKARKIEQAAAMPAMWLDTVHAPSQNLQEGKHTMTAVSTIPEILADIKAGKMVIITDAEDRENEGDLVMAAQFVTPEAINFMIKHARGLVCLPMENALVDKLGLPMMTQQNGAQYGTNFTVPSKRRKASPPAFPPPTAP